MATITQRLQAQLRGLSLEAARPHLEGARRTKRGGRPGNRLSLSERLEMLDGIERVIAGAYAHLPLKQARYGFDPVQRLRILRTQLKLLGDDAFNFELTDIIARLRDAHTKYDRPPLGKMNMAVLPFLIEAYGPVARPRFVISKVAAAIAHPHFKPGVHLVRWNGIPIERAVKRYSEREYGGRPDSALASALATMTARPLRFYDLPDENWVSVEYRSTDDSGKPHGPVREFKVNWGLVDGAAGDPIEMAGGARRQSRKLARNPVAVEVKRVKRMLFAAHSFSASAQLPPGPRSGKGAQFEAVPTGSSRLRAAKIQGPGGPYGYLRIWDFDVALDGLFLDRVCGVLHALPDRGLIIDVRGNPGGSIVAAEMALQFITPRRIEPTRFSMLATPLTRALCNVRSWREEFEPWKASLEAAVRNGETYSAAVPITDPGKCNATGQCYGGPVVLVADASTYSAGDLFCAGFVDNGIGPFVCVGESTGAGGANVWEYRWLRDALRNTPMALPNLPDRTGLDLAFRRATRAGPAAGTPIEDLGVPGTCYEMTYADVMEANRDLLAYCINLLRKQPFSRLNFRLSADAQRLTVSGDGLDAVDVLFDGRSGVSRRLQPGASVSIRVAPGAQRVELRGYQKKTLRQRRLIDLAG